MSNHGSNRERRLDDEFLSWTDHGGGKRRSVTAFCHINVPTTGLFGMRGRRYAPCRLRRRWFSNRVHDLGSGNDFKARQR
jgi:hypothetical protein